jgi:hypothetical protein
VSNDRKIADPISDDELKKSDVPPRGSDWSMIVRFAQSFNGYDSLGFEHCAELANGRKPCITLADIRACLFFEYRRHNHFGSPPDIQTLPRIEDLLDRIRELAPLG